MKSFTCFATPIYSN